ncbi:MAG: LCP family protein [Minisyncoccia bacterium]
MINCATVTSNGVDVISPQNLNELPETAKKRWFKRPLFFALLVALIAIGLFFYQFGSAYNSMVVSKSGFLQSIINAITGQKNDGQKQYTDNAFPMPSPEADRLDVLILGIHGDTAEQITNEGGLLTDTMQLVSIDRKTNEASMVSIPRDLYINMLGVNGKINEVYERGLANGDSMGLVKNVVSRITGVYVDKVVVFDFGAFQKIVDTIGGIDITLEQPFDEPTQWGYDFHLPAGPDHLDGQSALYYVRSRFSTSDFDRSRRQQDVVKAIKIKASQEGYLSNPIKINEMLNLIKGDIKTDFQIWDISDLAKLATHFTSDSQIKDYVIDTTNLLYESKDPVGAYILLPKGDNYDGIHKMFQDILTQISTPSPTSSK